MRYSVKSLTSFKTLLFRIINFNEGVKLYDTKSCSIKTYTVPKKKIQGGFHVCYMEQPLAGRLVTFLKRKSLIHNKSFADTAVR